jgi:hypothetical protein
MCRRPHERFIDTYKRIGADSFRAAAYGNTESESTEYERETANG